MPDNTISAANVNVIAERKMNEYYIKMTGLFSNVFPAGTNENVPKLVIALDEAHPLHESKGFSRATVLLRVIKSYSTSTSINHSVWVVFASTTSKVVHFASPHVLCRCHHTSLLFF